MSNIITISDNVWLNLIFITYLIYFTYILVRHVYGWFCLFGFISCSRAFLNLLAGGLLPLFVMGHDHLLKICLLEKSARHVFSFARHHLSNNYFFLSTARIQLIFGDQLDSSSFTFRQKNINCLNCKWSTKVFENINCSTQFIVKKMVYMYSS